MKDLDDEAARRLEEFLSRESIAGIIVRESYKRSYPYQIARFTWSVCEQ